MKNNERLLSAIGEINDKFISKKNIKKKSGLPIKLAAVGTACAAGFFGFFAVKNSGLFTKSYPWDGYRIFPEYEYGKDVWDGSEKIPMELNNAAYYSSGTTYAITSVGAKNMGEFDDGNPWSEELELTSLPVFKNLSFKGHADVPRRYYNEEQMLEMAENAAEALGLTIDSHMFYYDVSGYTDVLPYMLAAGCDGEAYGVELVDITVYGEGKIEIEFGDSIPSVDETFAKIPIDYKFANDTDKEEGEKTVSYLAERFENLLQFKAPVTSAPIDCYSSRRYTVFDESDDAVESILNYSLSYAEFTPAPYRRELETITLRNVLSVSEYMGDYPVISVSEAKERLLAGEYYSRDVKGETIAEEDIKKVDLLYLYDNQEYIRPFYRFYVKQPRPNWVDKDLEEYGMLFVPAVRQDMLFATDDADIRQAVLDAYPEAFVQLPDGSSVPVEEAVSTPNGDSSLTLVFDRAFLRNVRPIFRSTLDDPESFDFETGEFTEPLEYGEAEPRCFGVKTGDVLENGLTVKNAEYEVTWMGNSSVFMSTAAEFEGEITWEGVLHCVKEDEMMIEKGMLYFHPDVSEYPSVPDIYNGRNTEPYPFVLGNSALLSDGPSIYVGKEEDIPELSGAFESTDMIKVRVTLKNLSYYYSDTAAMFDGKKAEIKELEILKGQESD